MISKLAAFLRSPIRVGFVVLLTASLGLVSTGSVQAVNLWSPGDPSTLSANTGNVGSCSFATDATPGVTWSSRATGEEVRITGVCSAPANSLSLSDFQALDANHDLPTPSNILFAIYKNSNLTSGFSDPVMASSNPTQTYVQQIEAISILPCDGVADCVTFDVTVSKRTGSAGVFDTTGTNYGIWVSGFGRTMIQSTADRYSVPSFTQLLPVFDPPPFYYTEAYVPAVPNRCVNAQIGVQVEGQALTVADYDDVYYPLGSGRDDFVFVATFNDWDFTTDPLGMTLEYQWPDSSWQPMLPTILDAVSLNGGDDSAVSFRPLGGDRYLSQLQFRCRDLSDPLGSPGDRRHLAFWDPGSAVTLPNWTLGAAFLSPCRSITLNVPTGSLNPGDTGRIPYNLPGTDGLDLSVFAYGVADFSPSTSPSIMMSSSTLLGAATGGPAPFLNYVAAGSGWLTFVLPSTVAEPVSYSDLVFACSDLLDSGLIISGSADLGLTGYLPTPEASCWSTSGMKLTSPGSWILGLSRMLSCLAQELFVPDSAELLGQVQEMNDTVADRPPFVAVAAIVGFADDLSTSFTAVSGTGCFTAAQIPGVAATPETCVGDGLNVQPSQRTTMALLLCAPMILGLAGHMFGLLRGQSEYITEDNGQMAMRL